MGQMLEIVQMWGDHLLEERRFEPGRDVTAGDGVRSRLVALGIPLIPLPDDAGKILQDLHELTSLPLSAPTEATEDFHVPGQPAFRLIRWEAGRALVGSPDGSEVPMVEGATLRVGAGSMTFLVRRAAEARRAAWTFKADGLLLGVGAVMAGLFLFGAGLVGGAPAQTETASIAFEDRYLDILVQRPVEIPPAPSAGESDAAPGERAPGAEGSVGDRKGDKREAKGERKKRSKAEMDREAVANAGLFGAASDLADISGSGLPAGASAIGKLAGVAGIRIGGGGVGDRGPGFGGGGAPEEGGTGFGVRGTGASCGSPPDGCNGGDLGAKGEGGLGRGSRGEPTLIGNMDRSLIDEVIKRNMAQIRYCYQRELSKDQDLTGKISVNFTIARDGTVSRSVVKSSSMGSAAVETCITDRFMRFKFPEPKGGGIVIVSYPFTFSPG